MIERVPPGDSRPDAEGAAPSRHVEAADWFKRGNRRLHDGVLPPAWVLVRETAKLKANVTALEAKVAAFEQSTSWRLTAPLRWFKRRLDARRPQAEMAPPTAEVTDDSPFRAHIIRDPFAEYAAWITEDEAVFQAAIHPARVGGAIVTTPRVVLILTAIRPAREALAANLEALRGSVGPSCSLIATCVSTDAGREMLDQFARTEPNATVLVVPDRTTAAASKAAALAKAGAEFIGFLDLPDRIAPAAMRLIGEAVALDPQTELIFADEDLLDTASQRSDPFFKPGWDPELHRAGDLLGRLLVLRSDVLCRIGLPSDSTDGDWFRELGQRAVAACRPDRIHHIPAVLCHRALLPLAADAGTRTLARWRRVCHAIPISAPLVSLIVPTKDQADLLRTCVDGVLNGTAYSEIELLILDNGTREPEAIKLLRELEARARVRVLSLPGPFNWSSLNNTGAHAARGDILVLLNNDIAILQRDWLDELVAHAVRPEIGAVGAKLLYPDGTLEHAGMVIDTDGIPRHVFRRAPADTACLTGTFSVAHSVSVVTGACLALRRSTFFEVGGLDEGLGVSCNDVDLCLRLLSYGYRNVWTPYAVLEHREMASRGPDRTEAMRKRTAAELDRLSRNWGSAAVSDRYFNPNLVLVDEQPRLRRRHG
jgi:GT2 family glycosyltransferase